MTNNDEGIESIVAASTKSMPNEVVILDEDGTIIFVNEQWRRFADENKGRHPECWVGESYFETLEQAYNELHASQALEGLKSITTGSENRFKLEYPCHSPEKQRWYEMDATGFAYDSDRYLLIQHSEITDQKLSERRATARTKQLEILIRVLSHDIRNPLQVIDGYTEMIATELDNSESVARIRNAVARVTEITEATLAFSDTGTLSKVEPVSLATLVTKAWRTVVTDDAKLTIKDSKRFHGDHSLLLQMFENIFRNAVEHAGPNCTVTVGTLPEGFYVEDDGPGIPTEIREKAIQADFSTQGTGGLGLAIVHSVVTAHSGRLTITDAEGSGARLEITGFDVAP